MNRSLRTLVVGVTEMREGDPRVAPPGEDPVLAPAVQLAAARGATLHVVHVIEPASSPGAPLGAPSEEPLLDRRREVAERRLCQQLDRFGPDAPARLHLPVGIVEEELCGIVDLVRAELLVVGATRRAGMWHNFVGHTADRVLRRADVPVLVVRRPFRAPVRRVLLATDVSTASMVAHERGLDAVESIFSRTDLDHRALLVCPYDGCPDEDLAASALADGAAAALHGFLAARRQRAYPIGGKIRLGIPATEILREVDEWRADLLVLGGSDRTIPPADARESTGAAVLRGATCNVLVVPLSALASTNPREVQRSSGATAEAPGAVEVPSGAEPPLPLPAGPRPRDERPR